MATLKQVNRFYKKKKEIPEIVLSKTGNKEIIYGARAINKQVPMHLRKKTDDYDIFSKTPKKDALETERALDKKFGGNYFETKPAIHPGTYKVISRIDKVGYADYTIPDKKIPFKVINKKKYVDMEYVKKHIKQTLKDPEAKFRHAKDTDALNRIKLAEKLKRKKRVTPKQRFRKDMNRLFKF